ncbi:MAG: S53 family peptidase [Gaiellaceae bacterium]
MKKLVLLLAAVAAAVAVAALVGRGSTPVALPTVHPQLDDVAALGGTAHATPTQAQCAAIGRRCFTPQSMANSYNYAVLHAAGNQGQGKTIAIVDSYGEMNIEQDLKDFDTAFGLPDPPSFQHLCVQGCPAPKSPPPTSNGTGLEDKSHWGVEVALDVEWAHATAPLANILLVTTPTAETLGVQGFQQMMNAEQYVIDNHMADVITQSFGAGEGSFNNGLASLKQLRQAFVDAAANSVSVFASSGDGGSTNQMKTPVTNPADIPYPSVIWPASDPLVTAVGGTYLCTDPNTGTGVDNVSPPNQCRRWIGDREPAWVPSGGGYSIYFSRPSYQNTLPPGSSYVGSSPGAPGPNSQMRGVPDVAYQASALTGVLVYDSYDGGWFVVGGTSASSPQWAGIAAMADQIAGHDLGFLNPALYAIANDPAKYAADFYDPIHNTNQTTSIPGWPATPGWDAVTGLGTPNVANLIPDLIAASS